MIQMSRNISLWVISFLTVFALMVPASANVWRSSTGNIFRFQEDGSMTILRANGSADAGRWWWTNYGYSGQFVIFGEQGFKREFRGVLGRLLREAGQVFDLLQGFLGLFNIVG